MFGHVRQLEAVVGKVIEQAWTLGADLVGAGWSSMSIRPSVKSKARKQGAPYGYTKVLGYDPIRVSRADTGEILHAPLRRGSANIARGARRFIDELLARVRRAGAVGQIVMRLDSGFCSGHTIATRTRLKVRYRMGGRTNTKAVAALIADIGDDAWVDIDETPSGQAQVAETIYNTRRLIVRRTRLIDPAQGRGGPTGDTPPFSPISTATRSTSPPSIALTPASSWPSAISTKVLASTTSTRQNSGPTRPGCTSPCSPTTSSRWTANTGRPGSLDRPAVGPHRPPATAGHPRPAREPLWHPDPGTPARWPWWPLFTRRLDTIAHYQRPVHSPADWRPATTRR